MLRPLTLFAVIMLMTESGLSKPQVSEYNVPGPVKACLKALGDKYSISGRLNPFYLRCDFDGDRRPDYAVVISKAGQEGILICRGNSPTPIILGAGFEFNEMKDLRFDAWTVYPKSLVKRGVGEGRPPKLFGEAILLTWEESASALVYWNRKRFVWYQQGD